MPLLPRPAKATVVCGFLLTCAILLGVALVAQRWSPADWTSPSDLYGDPLEIYARVQVAREQPGQMLAGAGQIERLGAPGHADWSPYPLPDRIVFVATGALAHVLGVFGAVKAVAAAFYVLSGLSFFLCARYLRWRLEWAFVGGLLFALCNYHVRWAITLSINQTFTLPPLLLLCAHAVRKAPVAGGRWTALAVVLGLWLGQGNPYLAYFSGALAAATLGFAALRGAPRSRLRPLAAFLLSLSAAFLAWNHQHVLSHLGAETDRLIARDYAGSVKYALQPIDLIVPSADHRWEWAAQLGRRYSRQAGVIADFPPAYLGAGGIAGLLLLLGGTFRHLARWPGRPVPSAALGLVFVLLFAVPGGLNSLLAFAGLDLFRASQRISILVNIWALLQLGVTLHRATLHWPRRATVPLAAALAAFLAWEQSPAFAAARAREQLQTTWRALSEVTSRLEREIGREGLVFQLPVRHFPEAGTVHLMSDYEHFQPFLADSSLRFSYGPLRHTPAYQWQRRVSRRPAEDFIAALERRGFRALWINTRGYADGAAGLIASLRAAGLQEITADPALPVRLFRLEGTSRPEPLDPTDVRWQPPWHPDAPETAGASLHAVRGWYSLERAEGRSWRWARRRAVLGIWWPESAPQARLRATVGSLRDDTLRIRLGERVVATLALRGGQPTELDVRLPLQPGSNRVQFSLAGTAAYPPGGDPRLLGFALENVQVSPASP